ncbi:MAG: hypothetical protein HKN82_10805 [Akkermansiaceae bacterium]|nr:hypothetical protein [Akkermansiaceae bacterium]
MNVPEIPGYQIEGLIGKGACGAVYLARHESGSLVAAKVLSPESVNPALIANRVNRLYRSVPPKAAVPLIAHSLERAPYLLVSHLVADQVQEGMGDMPVPRTLQMSLGEFLGQRGSWMLVRRLAQVIAEFHRRRVAHGNLKPGNIYFDADGELLLSDYAQGLMPGIRELPYTDALLYAPPEQLRDPEGYLEGAGFGWDVYAFGVLAFRLVNGVFPRCDETFQRVAPVAGEARRRGVEADCERVAAKLDETEMSGWRGPSPTREEAEARDVIDRCLRLDPLERYADMGEVLRALEAIAASRQAREEQDEESEKILQLERRKRAWQTTAAIGVAASVVLGVMTAGTLFKQSRLPEAPPVAAEPPHDPGPDEPGAEDVSRTAVAEARREAERAARSSESLRARYGRMAEDLANSYALTDRLLAWTVESGSEELPVLEGRTERIRALDQSLRDLLEQSERHPPMARQRWRIELALAEVALAGKQAGAARERFAAALEHAPPDDGTVAHRMARARLLICLLGSEDPAMGVSESEIAEARTAVEELSISKDEREKMVAALNLAEARRLRVAGATEESLEVYRYAFETMTRLCESQPQLTALRAWRARGFGEAGRVADGNGMEDTAVLLQQQSAAELLELIESQPQRDDLKLDLAEALGALAESALDLGEMERAERMAKRAAEYLEAIAQGNRADDRVLVRLAGLKAVLAACQRDAGKGDIAMRLVDEGIRHAREALEKNSGSEMAKFRLALLNWQKASLHGLNGERSEEIRLGTEARDALNGLLVSGGHYPTPRQLRRSLAYLTTDLGHAAQLAGNDGQAVKFFRESMGTWTALASLDRGNSEFEDGLDWAKERLRELGSLSSLPPKAR